jgi:NAD(P)-dependent dehydrogenase (short-subunit alcohol dehydrogenase family)
VAETDLSGRVVVVTGASRGLGAGMANWFAAQGAQVGTCARHEPTAPPGTKSVTAAVDVTDFAAVQAFAATVSDQLGPPDLWVNNAGVLAPIVAQRHLTAEALAEHLAINVGGVLNGTRAFLGQLERAGTVGALVNIGSGAATAGRAGWSAYCAAKAAVDRLSEAVAIEEEARLPVVLSVYPGLIETAMQELIRSQSADVQPDVAWFRKRHEDGAMNDPAWVAEVVSGWVFGPDRPGRVICQVPDQPR